MTLLSSLIYSKQFLITITFAQLVCIYSYIHMYIHACVSQFYNDHLNLLYDNTPVISM